METTFKPKLDILPAPQRALWREFTSLPEEFVLYGGTALALHFGHRDSIDFDFFANRDINPVALFTELPFLRNAQIIQQEPNTLTCIVDRAGDIKLSFFGLPHLARIAPPHVCADNGLRIASVLDLAATKVAVVQQRAQAKDYLDIDALLREGTDLSQALSAAKHVYGDAFMPTPTLKALSYYGDGDLASLPEDVKRRLAEAVRNVDPARLPGLTRTTDAERRDSHK